jgi:hypothetical protein
VGIQTNRNLKDRLKEGAPHLTLVEDLSSNDEQGNSLQFWTKHPTKPVLVDLHEFKTGLQESKKNNYQWKGTFLGRPELIEEMAPSIRDHLSPLAKASVQQFLVSLRRWWRLLEAVEVGGSNMAPLVSVSQLSEIHRQAALDQGMDRLQFSNFLLLANSTRAALGLKLLFWQRPESSTKGRHLPPTWQTDLIRRTLKRRWFTVLDRWALAEDLLAEGSPIISHEGNPVAHEEQARLLRNYQALARAIEKTGHPRPDRAAAQGSLSQREFYDNGYVHSDMLRGWYPDGEDIRTAFHLCLATTGWNPAVFLSLNVNGTFIEAHPKDPNRYVLRGVKARGGGSEQVSEGLYKTEGSAGVILQTLVQRTQPLRNELLRELKGCKEALASGITVDAEQVNSLKKRIAALEQGVNSPWLFASKVRAGIQWLTDANFSTLLGGNMAISYLAHHINQLNTSQPIDRQLSIITATDLRDAYASYVYRVSGGSILTVMKALNHRSISSTKVYLDNTLLKEEHRKLYDTFSSALWSEITIFKRVDPTVLAKWARDGEVTESQRQRLADYRTLLLSRIGVGCKNPHNPPGHIAPNFVADGKEMCHVHRCLLCLENAVILPESLRGLCKRLAELRHLKMTISVYAYQESSFPEELENTEIAIQFFDSAEVTRQVTYWTERIADGTHRVSSFDGFNEGARA